tara:strand:- start:312 stop:500 length:189 start_codon:yes stop_codon:yes gene_type:complete
MKKTTEDGKQIYSHEQKLYKVGFGPDMYGIISEDSLERYSNMIGIEEHGTRTIYYVIQEEFL